MPLQPASHSSSVQRLPAASTCTQSSKSDHTSKPVKTNAIFLFEYESNQIKSCSFFFVCAAADEDCVTDVPELLYGPCHRAVCLFGQVTTRGGGDVRCVLFKTNVLFIFLAFSLLNAHIGQRILTEQTSKVVAIRDTRLCRGRYILHCYANEDTLRPLTVDSLAALRQRPQHVAQRVRRPPPRRDLKSRESCELRGRRKILRRACSRFPIPLRALSKFINETDEIDRPFSTCRFPNKTGYASRTPR